MTRRVLGSLKKDVRIYVFFSPNGKKSPGGDLFEDTEALLKEYEYAGKRRVHVETIDPYRNLSRTRELQDRYKFGPNDNLIILDYDGKQKNIPAALLNFGRRRMPRCFDTRLPKERLAAGAVGTVVPGHLPSAGDEVSRLSRLAAGCGCVRLSAGCRQACGAEIAPL